MGLRARKPRPHLRRAGSPAEAGSVLSRVPGDKWEEEDARGMEWERCQARGQGSLGGDSSCARDTMCLASSPGGSTNMGSQGGGAGPAGRPLQTAVHEGAHDAHGLGSAAGVPLPQHPTH